MNYQEPLVFMFFYAGLSTFILLLMCRYGRINNDNNNNNEVAVCQIRIIMVFHI